MPTSRLFGWGFGLSVLVVALAAYIGLQRPLQSFGTDDDIYCYEGIYTASALAKGVIPKCFTVSEGKFSQILADLPTSYQSTDLKNGYAYPGLWDGHGHLLQFGEFLHSVDLFGSSSFEEVRSRVVDYVKSHPGTGTRDNWIRGVGWDQMALGAMPTAVSILKDLHIREVDIAVLMRYQDMLDKDDALKAQYIMLDRVDVHCVWVSQAVLGLLPDDLPDVPGGEIVRDPGMGVFCDNAMDVVMAVWPRPDGKKKKEAVKSAMKSLHAVGLVGMHDAGVIPEDLELYQKMSRTADWTLRVYAMIECKERNTFCPEKAPWIEEENGMLYVKSVKLFAGKSYSSQLRSSLTSSRWCIGQLGKCYDRTIQRQTRCIRVTTCGCDNVDFFNKVMVGCRVSSQHPRHRRSCKSASH